MRASPQEQTGSAGVSEVSGKFERLGWGPVRNEAHDLGTDLLVQARDQRRFDRGLIVGVQVKGGPTWFDDPESGPDGQVVGWWYYEPGTAHFDDWVTHGLPHLLVLHDLDADVSYWEHVTADRVIGTGRGCKILVPRTQTVDQSCLDQLWEVAVQQKARQQLEGSSFVASASTVPPGRRLRHALLAPRLVAPHRNTGYGSSITAEEGLALCAQGRFLDLSRFADKHRGVPDPRKPYGGRNWRWSLVHAFWAWAIDDGVEPLLEASRRTADVEAKAAVSVLLACALSRREQATDALRMLDELIDQDELGPVDHGWMLIQRARLRAETGDMSGAREDAVAAQHQFPGDQDDVTVSVLASAAAWLLFSTADWSSRDIKNALTAGDTAVSWWRSQTISWALDEAAEQAFRTWAQDMATHWTVEDREELNLFSAELNAELAGEQSAWRGVASLAARQALVRAHQQGDHDEVASELDHLRRSGDGKSLELAARHLRRIGPADALAAAVGLLQETSWTHTAAHANLVLLEHGGDLASHEAADTWLHMLVEVMRDQASFEERVRPTFMVELAAAKAIEGLLPASSAAARIQVAELLGSFAEPPHDVLDGPITGWLEHLGAEQLTPFVREGFLRIGTADEGRLGAEVLAWLAKHGDAPAQNLVQQRALRGDLDALVALNDVTALTTHQAEPLLEKFESMIRGKIAKAEKGTHSFGGFDPGALLAQFNGWFPEVARWRPVVELLLHPEVAANDKRHALRVLFHAPDRIPDEVRTALAASIDAISKTAALPGFGGRGELGALPVMLAIVLGAIDPISAHVAISRLALGSQQERCDAAELLGRGHCERMRPLLASFVADGRTPVRSAAAQAVGRLASLVEDPIVVSLVEVLTADDGVTIPWALLAGLSEANEANQVARAAATRLAGHPSAHVRRFSRHILEGHDSLAGN